ncbi:MAG: PspA/IM30 family protein [Phormidesmis sp.]
MSQLFNRISHMAQAELNSNEGNRKKNYFNEGTALAAGGAVAGASIGKVGILAGGAGYSLGAVPLAAVGTLTGLALYEALRSLIESDASSVSAAATGAAGGIATSCAIGGVGVAAGGSAIGVGMASMAAGGAVVGLGFAGLNRLLQQGIEPEELLDGAIEQMETDLQNARQAAFNAVVNQKRLQQEYEKTQAEVKKWKQRAQLALRKGDECLAREALKRKNMHVSVLSSLEASLDQEPALVRNLKQNLALLEAKISEAKAMSPILRTQISADKARPRRSTVSTSSAMSGFERMEQKILQMEARSQAVTELAEASLESQLDTMDSDSDIDMELENLKRALEQR